MTIRITSFSYKYGKPPEGATVYDCRKLPNPHLVPELKDLDGRNPRVQMWLLEKAHEMTTRLLLKAAVAAIKGQPVAFGCIGGKHRSVALAHLLTVQITREGRPCETEHTALEAPK